MKLRIILSVIILMCLTACQDDLSESIGKGDNSLRLYAGGTSEYVKSRAGAKYPFSAGTNFHLFATEAVATTVDGETVYEDKDWIINYLSRSGSERMIEVTAASPEPNQLTGDDLTPVFLTKPMNLYGVTVVGANSDEVADTEEVVQDNNEILATLRREKYMDENQIPHYEIKYGGSWSTKSVSNTLPDIMSCCDTLKGLTPFYNAGNIVMPFRHTLSKLNFYAILGDGMKDKVGTIKIKSLSLTDYEGGMLCLRDGLYERGGEHAGGGDDVRDYNVDVVTYGADEQPVVEYFDHSGETTPMPKKFCSALIFPTTGADYKHKFHSVDAESGAEKAPVGHEVKVDLVVTVDGVDKEYKNLLLKHYGAATVFHPNYEYDITFSITTSTVVITLLPKYYDYYEETPTVLNDSELGEPIDFGGVLWAPQNLGATSANPLASPEDWEKARGFYYQYGRNIPYYVRGSVLDPYPDVAIYNGSGTTSYDLFDCETSQRFLYTDERTNNINIPHGATDKGYFLEHPHGARAYPYIPSLWEYEVEKSGKVDGYKAFLKNCRMYSSKGINSTSNEQTEPDMNYSDPYDARHVFDNTEQYSKRLAFSAYYMGGWAYTRYWCGAKKGDDTFQIDAHKNWVATNNKGANPSDPSPKGWRLPSQAEFLSIFPPTQELGDIAFTNSARHNATTGEVTTRSYKSTSVASQDYKGMSAVYVGIYQDGLGHNDMGYFSCADGHKDPEGWGSIYAVKCQGTSEAYAIRLHVQVVDSGMTGEGKEINPVLTTYEGKNIGRGVLVISKYDLGANPADICIDAVETGVASGGKAAEYRCRVFRDANGNKSFDDKEEIVTDFSWNKPSGILYLPVSGYVIAPSAGGQALIYPGTEGLYWTSDNYNDGKYGYFGSAVRIKYAGDHESRYIYVSNKEHIANGCNIRCVRDTKASY